MPSIIAATLLHDAGREIRRGEDSALTLRVSADPMPELVQISFAPLFADATAQAGLDVRAPEPWMAAYAERLAAWELRRPAGVEQAGSVEVTFAGVRPTIPVGEALLPLVAGESRTTLELHVLPPPRPTERALFDALSVEVVGDAAVAISRRADEVLRGELLLSVSNVSEAPLRTGGWGPWPPTLTLVFVTAKDPPGETALTTPGRLDDIDVVIERGAGWRVVKRRPGPEWDIVAVPAGGRHEVFAAGEELLLALRGITTDFAPGPTTVELRSYGFPGFADGIHPVTVDKRATPMRVTEPLRCTAPVANGTTELSWRIEFASHVQLSGVGEVPPHVEGFTVPVRRDTTFVLTAYDALLGTVAIQDCRVEAGSAAPPGPLPRGAIVAFEGEPIPDGFARCDGSVPGVPDLRGRFIRGAGNGLADGIDGGGAPHDHDPIHLRLHGALAEDPHTHTPPDDWQETQLRKGKARVPLPAGDVRAPSGAEEHGHALEALDVEVAFGAAQPEAPRPPWRALTYIMKL